MKYLILVVAVVSSKLFFSAASILGVSYDGAEESAAYILYTAVISIVAVMIYVAGVVHRGGLRKTDIKILAIPVVLTAWFLLEAVASGEFPAEALKTMVYFLIWSLPAMLCGLYLANEKNFTKALKYFDVVVIVFTLSALTAVIFPFVAGKGFETLAGASYQTMSYVAAIAFGLNLNFLFLGGSRDRFKFANSSLYQVICVCILPIQLASVVLPGGRGATVLSVLYVLLVPLLSYRVATAKNRNRVLLVLGFLLLIGSIYVPTFILGSDIASAGLDRAIQFLGSDGQLNWDGSSGRDVIYDKALSLIAERPIFGYGLFGFASYLGAPYAHNIFLDLLLSGGVAFFLASVVVLGFLVIRAKWAVRVDERMSVVVVLLIYALVSLMFSGTFLVATEFWFAFCLLFAWRKHRSASVD